MVDINQDSDLLDYLKLDPDHHEKIAALIPKETWYEQLIRYGLYIGAVFQMICILVSFLLQPRLIIKLLFQAVILLPEKEGSEDCESSFSDDDDVKSRAGSPNYFNSGKKQKRKHDKKKPKQL